MDPRNNIKFLVFLYVFLCVKSQVYQYSYPYPYQQQQQQVATYPTGYQGYQYYLPPQSYYPNYQNSYVAPRNNQGYSYSYGYYGTPNNGQSYQGNQVTTAKPVTTTADPFANIKSEIIDVDPQHFNYLMGYMNMQPGVPNFQTAPGVRVQTVPGVTRTVVPGKPDYIVSVKSNSFNQTSVPTVIKKHEVQHKVYSFRKTYVITPENRNKVINLSFVNGVPVNTTESPESSKEQLTEATKTQTEIETTTESDNPNESTKVTRRFIDVPESCPEGTKYTAGKCFKTFTLSINDTDPNEKNAQNDTIFSKVQVLSQIVVT